MTTILVILVIAMLLITGAKTMLKSAVRGFRNLTKR